MKELSPPETPAFLPLEKLLKFPRGKRHVTVDQTLVPKIDLLALRRSVHFRFDHNYYGANVSVTPDSRPGLFYVQMSISPHYSDWPQPNEAFRQLYCAALGTAAKQAVTKDRSEQPRRPYVIIRSDHIIMGYDSVTLTYSFELLAMLRWTLDTTRDELPSVIAVLANGPIPGTTPVEADD